MPGAFIAATVVVEAGKLCFWSRGRTTPKDRRCRTKRCGSVESSGNVEEVNKRDAEAALQRPSLEWVFAAVGDTWSGAPRLEGMFVEPARGWLPNPELETFSVLSPPCVENGAACFGLASVYNRRDKMTCTRQARATTSFCAKGSHATALPFLAAGILRRRGSKPDRTLIGSCCHVSVFSAHAVGTGGWLPNPERNLHANTHFDTLLHHMEQGAAECKTGERTASKRSLQAQSR